MTDRFPPKALVVGTPISLTSYAGLLDVLAQRPDDQATVVAVCTVHSVMTGRRDPAVAAALHDADVATPDGMPLVWALRATVRPDQGRVYGPDLLPLALRHGRALGWRHFFYGATDETLQKLVAEAERHAPGVHIAGSYAPPFRPLTPAEEEAVAQDIRASGADLVWVGLGMPKQELWMHRMRERLPGVALLGVGAAFDFMAGTVRQAPRWVQNAGLEWLFRLAQEPRRLWRRYVWNNPAFLALVGRQLVRQRLGRRG